MKNFIKYIGLLVIPFCLIIVSCDNEDSYPDTTAYETVIKEIKIMNAQELIGAETLLGKIDESKKKITFPEVNPEADLSKIQFDAILPDGARLDTTEYDFSMEEGVSTKTLIVKVLNETRFREYEVTIDLDVPVWGADFSDKKAKIYDFTGVTSNLLQEFSGADGRQSSISDKNIYIASRSASVLLNLAALKEGRIERTPLNLTDVTGWMAVNGGCMAHGHIYSINMISSTTARIGHWLESSPTDKPLVTFIYNLGDLSPWDLRYDGYISTDIDKEGNGNIYIHSSTSYLPKNSSILKIPVSGFTNFGSPSTFKTGATANPGSWSSFNKIVNKDEYVYTGHQGPLMLASSDGSILYTMPTSVLAATSAANAKIIEFNEERYLITASSGSGSVSVYDITKGETTSEALSLIDIKKPVFSYTYGGTIGDASVTIDWMKDGEETLYLLSSAPGAGLVLVEFPKKVKEPFEY